MGMWWGAQQTQSLLSQVSVPVEVQTIIGITKETG